MNNRTAFGLLLAGALLLASPIGAPSIQAQNVPGDAPRVTGRVVHPSDHEVNEADFSKILVINNSKSPCTLQLRRLRGKNWATVGSVNARQDYEISTGDEKDYQFYLVARTANVVSELAKVEVGRGYSIEGNAGNVWITAR